MAELAYAIPTEKHVNVASVPHRSPFRYPGGKTWLIPYARLWLNQRPRRYQQLIEPFAGGGIIGITAAVEGLVDRVVLIELDPSVAAVWETIFHGEGRELAERILAFIPTVKNVHILFEREPKSLLDKAFVTIVRNRVQRGAILAPGAGIMNKGENGKGLASRWYPETLHRRILDLISAKNRIKFIHGDGIEYMRKHVDNRNSAFFIDPPYTTAGKRLYRYSEVDHTLLFTMVKAAAGGTLMTYDDSSEIRQLTVKYRLDCETVSMKNTHNSDKTELLIGKSLSWLRTSTT